MTTEEAIVTSLNTSGRAVLFAGITVCIALLGMLLLGFSFLDGLGIAAALTVAITMLAALTLLPALLAFQKSKVLSRRERRKFAAEDPSPPCSKVAGSAGRASSRAALASSPSRHSCSSSPWDCRSSHCT